MYPGFNDFLGIENEFMPCECCKPRYATSTFTIRSGYKYTKKDIEENIIELSKELNEVKWYERGDTRRQLKHWHDKLARYEEAKEEFNFKK